MKVALYARVSTDGQDPELQLSALRAHAANRGWVITDEFIDQGYSGSKETRPALQRLMKAAWAGGLQAVLVWRFDSSIRPRRSGRPCSPLSAPWPNSSGISSASEFVRGWPSPKRGEDDSGGRRSE